MPSEAGLSVRQPVMDELQIVVGRVHDQRNWVQRVSVTDSSDKATLSLLDDNESASR